MFDRIKRKLNQSWKWLNEPDEDPEEYRLRLIKYAEIDMKLAFMSGVLAGVTAARNLGPKDPEECYQEFMKERRR